MKYFLKLSKEHPKLPQAEVESVLEGERMEYAASLDGDILFVDVGGNDPTYLSRLAYTKRAAEYLGESTSLDELSGTVYDQICGSGTFRITSKPRIQAKMGALIAEMGLEVDLRNPDAEVVVIEKGEKYVAGVDATPERDYESRKPQHRPYFHPTSLHPKLARAAVNLASTGRGDTVLDPFAGTGGILIEAGLMGMQPLGWDIDEKMVEGAKANLREYGVDATVRRCDATRESFEADAVIADLPYGRASYACKDIQRLYSEFAENAEDLLAPDSKMCLIHPADMDMEPQGLRLVRQFDMRMHRSLTRRLSVFSNV